MNSYTLRDVQLAAIKHKPLENKTPADAIVVENAAKIASFLNIPQDRVAAKLNISGQLLCPRWRDPLPSEDSCPVINEWGTSELDHSAQRYYPLAKCTGIHDVERYAFPDPCYYDFAALKQQAEHLQKSAATRGPGWRPLFSRVYDLLGIENTMIKLILEPEIFEAVLDKVFEFTWLHCQQYLDIMGDDLDIFYIGDDFATQRGLMISPELWRKYLKPLYAKLFELGKKHDKFIWFHSCGNITDVLDDLIDIGMDIWETVQLHTLPMSPKQLKENYGRHITFFGAINTQTLPFKTPDQVRQEVRECITVLGKDGGYICGPDHHIKPDVPLENILAIFDEIQQCSMR